jgi:hypothetical protein
MSGAHFETRFLKRLAHYGVKHLFSSLETASGKVVQVAVLGFLNQQDLGEGTRIRH